jgi:hypothetical protein
MENFSDNLNRLNGIMKSLINKYVKISMTNGDDLTVVLKEILPQELLVSPSKDSKLVGVISTSSICYILEKTEKEWDIED